MSWRLAVQMLILVLGVAVCSSALAQAKYPRRHIDLIVTFSPGGASDSSARSMTPYLSKYLGVPVVVKNAPPPRTGTDIFSRSRPNGYTLAHLAGTAIGSDETFYKVRYRGRKFVWIGTNARTPGLMFANANGPVKNFEDLARIGAKRPIKIGCFSIFSSSTVAAATALTEKKIPFTYVTGFRGAAPSLTALIRGEVDVVGTTLGSGSALYKAGEIRPLVIYQMEKSEQIPAAPTIPQAGLSPSATYLGSVHYGLAAPPGTSNEIKAVLSAALKKTVDDPAYQAQLKKVGFSLDYVPAEKMDEWINNYFKAFEKVKPMVLKAAKKK
jgi:tripartite-type tricarboxylate transporter receptor subunit TctC